MLFRVRALPVNQETGLIEIPAGWIPLRYDAYVDQTGQSGTPGAYIFQIVALEPVVATQPGSMQTGQQMQGMQPGMMPRNQPGPVMQQKREKPDGIL